MTVLCSYTHDDMEAIERKHKSRPSTEAEISDCGQFLEPWQLALISCGPSVLDFGTIFVRLTRMLFSVLLS